MAALATSGTAWTRSVPTICDIGSAGYSSSNMMMISEPEPTDVSPTTRPPRIPMTSVATGRTTTGVTSLWRRFRIGRTIRPVMTASSAIPSAVFMCDCSAGPASMRLRSMTPRNADGIDPAISQATSRPVHGAVAPVNGAADRLHDHRRHDVAGDGGQRLDVEEQHEDRRHERAAPHPGQADDEADEEAGEDDKRVDHGAGGGAARKRAPDTTVAGAPPHSSVTAVVWLWTKAANRPPGYSSW